MKLGKIIGIKPLEKPLFTIDLQALKEYFVAGSMLLAFGLSPFLMAFIGHSHFAATALRYLCETMPQQ
jgi:hypothetical protein